MMNISDRAMRVLFPATSALSNYTTNEGETMSETKHTPGPWHITNHGTVDAADRQIASVHNGGIMNMGNARLIAAAPDLLEALGALLKTAYAGGLLIGEAHQMAEKAIAKATGATP